MTSVHHFNNLDNNLPAGTGNVSNPSPQAEDVESTGTNQLLNKKAEKYLREAGNIEDMPDAEDEQEMDNLIKEEKKI